MSEHLLHPCQDVRCLGVPPANVLLTQTVVTINQYCANRSARNFRDPDTFIPDRWLNDPAYDGDQKNVAQPFSVGPRDCPGKA